ncbi:MAG: tetratricopeptide repeat protein [Deltaproteobacteria bacterium]|nr:tetratricopeptide repeat protein [Deltaproteobacteria bacterium]
MTARELHAKALKLHSEKRYGAAIDVWQKELQLNADIPNTTNNIGIEYAALSAFNTAKQYNLKAVNLDPGFAHAYYSLSRVNFKLTEYKEAAANASKAIELGYVNADVYYTLAVAQAHLKNYESAIEAYKKVIYLSPKYPLAHIELGFNYRAAGKLDMAEAEFKQELSVKNGAKTAAELALAETLAERAAGDKDKLFQAALGFQNYEDNFKVYRKEEAVLQEIINIDPQYPQAHYQLGRLYEKLDWFLTAKDELLLELKYHPDSENAASRLANLNAKIEERADAGFKGSRFPRKVMVVGKDTSIYDNSYQNKSSPSEGDILTVTGFYGKRVNRLIFICSAGRDRLSNKKIPRRFDYDVLYTVKNGGLVRAVDVILEDCIKKPALTSPSRKITIVENQIATSDTYKKTAPAKGIFALWLKKKTGKFILLTEVNETKMALDKAVRFSPDEKYFFIVPTATLMSAESVSVWEGKDKLTSPLLLNDIVFLRGINENDAVYTFDLKTFILKKFIDVDDGVRFGDSKDDTIAVWNPVRFENGIFTADFIRRHLRPPNPDAPCMLIVVKADENGKILGKEITETNECELL